MTAEHLSDWELDQLILRGPGAEISPHPHLAACPSCSNELAAMRAARERFVADVFPRTRPAIRARAGRWLPVRFGWASLALAPALGALLVWLLPRFRPPPSIRLEPDLSLKSAPALHAFARRGDRVFAIREGAVLREGDLVRFEVVAAGLPYILIASIDGAGKATILYPFDGERSAPIGLPDQPSGTSGRFVTPGSAALDAAPGPERVFAFLSRVPVQAEAAKAALEALGRRGPAAIRAEGSLPLPGVERQLTVFWEKEPP